MSTTVVKIKPIRNRAKVERFRADWPQIAQRLLTGSTTVTQVAREYGVSHTFAQYTYAALVPVEQRRAARDGKIVAMRRSQAAARAAQVAADAERIVDRLLNDPRSSVRAIARQYHVAAHQIADLLRRSATEQQRKAALSAKRALGRKGKGSWNAGLHVGSGVRVTGSANGAYIPVGGITVRKDHGRTQRWIKLRDDGPYKLRFEPLIVHRWRAAHGGRPVPRGMYVRPRDGNWMHDEVDNAELARQGRDIQAILREQPEAAARRNAQARRTLQSPKAALGRRRAAEARRRLREARLLRIASEQRRQVRLGAIGWSCEACGWDAEAGTAGIDRPRRCPKCGSAALSMTRRMLEAA